VSLRKVVQKFERISRYGLSLIPSKNNIVAVTLHSIAYNEWQWFEDVVQMIDEKYGFIHPDEINAAFDDKSSKIQVLLTFDDGFLSNRLIAEKILSKYNIKACFFVTEAFVGLRGQDALNFAQANFYPKRDMITSKHTQCDAMDWDDILWLKEQGHIIGAHTQYHPVLSSLSRREKREEIVISSDLMEEKLACQVRCFAYPFGSLSAVDSDSVGMARERFDLAFSNIRGGIKESPSRFFVFRQNIVPGMPLWVVAAIIEGKLDWMYCIMRYKVKRLSTP